MSIYQELVSHDQIFSTLTHTPVIVNVLDLETTEGRQNLQDLLFTRYEGDALNVLPSCDCGEVTDNSNLGVICDNCGTECISIVDKKLESTLWIQCPKGIRALINPAVWTMMTATFTSSGFNAIEWACNPLYRPTNPNNPTYRKLDLLDIPRGWNAFIDNFDYILQTLFQQGAHKGSNQDIEDLFAMLRDQRDKVFSQYIPIPSKIGFVLEANTVVSFADTTMTYAIDALKTIASIENSSAHMTQRSIELRVMKAIASLAEYYVVFAGKTLAGKPGAFRKHVFGGRAHFTFRAVITSITKPHWHEELHLPWSLSVNLFRVHLTNKLIRRNLSPIEIARFLDQNTLQYHPLLDELFHELINEAPVTADVPVRGIRTIFQRNPSLMRGSIQRFVISKIKTDVCDNTVSLSALVLRGFNADFVKSLFYKGFLSVGVLLV